jgi:hypothetical protein
MRERRGATQHTSRFFPVAHTDDVINLLERLIGERRRIRGALPIVFGDKSDESGPLTRTKRQPMSWAGDRRPAREVWDRPKRPGLIVCVVVTRATGVEENAVVPLTSGSRTLERPLTSDSYDANVFMESRHQVHCRRLARFARESARCCLR